MEVALLSFEDRDLFDMNEIYRIDMNTSVTDNK